MSSPIVGVVMGSTSDLDVVRPGLHILDELSIPFEVRALSAHRTPDLAREYAVRAQDRGLKVLIAAAGRAAHLPGVLASHTLLPVIGLPVGGGALAGVDALYSIVQMPSGVPVASVGIDGAANAALLAAQIVATADADVAQRLADWRKARTEQAVQADQKLQAQGWNEAK